MPTKFTIQVVDEITPISGFEYAALEIAQYAPISAQPKEGMQGNYVTYSFVDLDPKFEGQLTINPRIMVRSLQKGKYSIPEGRYEVKVQADNSKEIRLSQLSY